MINKRVSLVSLKLAALVSASTAFQQLPSNSLLSQKTPISFISTFPQHNRHDRRHDSTSTTSLHVSWSNGQAIQEYQDFLSGKSNSNSDDFDNDGPSVVIASPEFNYPLVDALLSLGNGDDIVIGPNDPLPTHVQQRDKFPIYVALPPPLLSSALSQNLLGNWEDKRDDLVFFTIDKGCIEDILKTYGLMRDATTQVLTSFTTQTPSLPGQQPTIIQDLSVRFGTDANGEEKTAMETVTCGKWREAIAQRLEKSETLRNPVRRSFHREWRRHMWEKTTFDACFNLVGAVRDQPTSIKDVALYYGDEVSEMAWQLSGLLRGAMAVTLTYGFEERMFEYAEQRGGDVTCFVSDETFPFTNGLFWEYSAKGLRAGFGDPAPMHTEYVGYAVQARGLLKGVEVPEINVEQTRSTIMRQGNLRADGAI